MEKNEQVLRDMIWNYAANHHSATQIAKAILDAIELDVEEIESILNDTPYLDIDEVAREIVEAKPIRIRDGQETQEEKASNA